MEKETVAPGLLVATPHLKDPNFEKAVILMIEHHARGALGMIVNRPTETTVAQALASVKVSWHGDPGAVLWNGGPVMPESCWMLYQADPDFQNQSDEIRLQPDLVISSSRDRLSALARRPPEKLRFVRGVAGWGPAQLEDEFSQGQWLAADLSNDLLFDLPAEDMWRNAYERLGLDPAFLAQNRGVH